MLGPHRQQHVAERRVFQADNGRGYAWDSAWIHSHLSGTGDAPLRARAEYLRLVLLRITDSRTDANAT